MIYVEDPMESKQSYENCCEFSKVAADKVNIQKSIVFYILSMNNRNLKFLISSEI